MDLDDDDILLGFGAAPTKGKRGKPRTSRGALHDLLTRALPDFVDPVSRVCDVHKLAAELDMTPQGVYKWMRPNRPARIAATQVKRIVALSEKSKRGGPSFKPVTFGDFAHFMS